MADDLEENFEIGDEFMPSARPQEVNISEEEEEEIKEVNKPTTNTTNKRKQPPTTETSSKKKKRKNITEILELKKSEMSKASFATREFIKILSEYAQKKLSGVEKNELNLGGDIDARLGDMILKRKKTHRLEVGEQFKKKFVKKLRSHKKAQNPSRDRRSPFIVVLAQSAVRCIDLHKQISNSLPSNLMGSLNWLYAFAKHKKLAEQVTFINEKFKRDEKYSLDIVYATPQRFKQLVDAGCLSTKSVEFVFVDYSFRDLKLKRIVDHNEIRADLSDLVYKCFLPVNAAADRIYLKFYLA